ncbi:hypothetical protein ES703_60965 [subsurface metagenome]
MVKGRTTTVIAVRLPDDVLALLKAKAAREGIPYTVFLRQLILKKLGLTQR